MSENIVCKTAVVANITEISTKQLCEFSDKQILRLSGTQIPVGIILYEMKKGLNKRFFQKNMRNA